MQAPSDTGLTEKANTYANNLSGFADAPPPPLSGEAHILLSLRHLLRKYHLPRQREV